jgi:hypothetical protein
MNADDNNVNVPLILLLVAALWGLTNPLLKAFADVDPTAEASSCTTSPRRPASSTTTTIVGGALRLFTRPRFALAYGCNQLGSAAYLYALSIAPLSLVLPCANSLTFVFTAVADAALARHWQTSGAASSTNDIRSAKDGDADDGGAAGRALTRGRLLGMTLIVAGSALCVSVQS